MRPSGTGPAWPVALVKRPARRRHGQIDVLCGRRGNPRQNRLVTRIERVENTALNRGDPFATDVQPLIVTHGTLLDPAVPTLLVKLFGDLQLLAVIDPEHVDFIHFHGRHRQSRFVGHRHRFGEVVLALGVQVADTLQQPQTGIGAQAHDAAVAEVDVQLLRACIPGFANDPQAPLLHQQPPVRPGLLGVETRHRHRRAVNQCPAQAIQGLRGDQG
ncbi:hypothetical protein D3C75_602010 [compost metagenome]